MVQHAPQGNDLSGAHDVRWVELPAGEFFLQ
jgi:hypothetical protein